MLPQAAVSAPVVAPDRAWIERELVMCALSPQYFIERYCQIYDSVAQNWIPFSLWDAQQEALRALHGNKLTVALKPRQVGFTWLGLAYDLWGMLFRPIWVGLIFSRRDDEAMYLLGEDRLRGMYKRLPSWMRSKSILVDSAHEFKLSNGSVSRAFPTTAGDGYTATYVLIDEADLQPDLNQLMRAVKPTIDAGGKLFMISRVNKRTPNSEFKRTYQSAKAGGNGWAHLFIGWDAHPGRDQAWYETQRREVMERTGSLDDLYEQYPSTDAEALAPRSLDKRIPPTQLLRVYIEQRAFAELPDSAPSMNGLRVFVLPEPGCKYVMGADSAEGNPTSDDSAVQVVDDATGEQVAVWQGKFEPSTFGGGIAALSRWYNKAAVLPERNNHGHAVILWLKDNARDVTILNGEDKKPGWHSTSKGKVLMYSTLADDVRAEETTIHDSATFEQVASVEGSTLRAPEGDHDDLADAYALALQARAVPANTFQFTVVQR